MGQTRRTFIDSVGDKQNRTLLQNLIGDQTSTLTERIKEEYGLKDKLKLC